MSKITIGEAIDKGDAIALKSLLDKSSIIWRIYNLYPTSPNRYFGDGGFHHLYTAAQRGNPECLQIILDAGGNPNATVGKYTALIAAACGGHAECMRLLINAGADIHLQVRDGSTALEYALEHQDNSECLKAILESPGSSKISLERLNAIVGNENNLLPEIATLIRNHLEQCIADKAQKIINRIPSIIAYLNRHTNDAERLIKTLQHWSNIILTESNNNSGMVMCKVTLDPIKMSDTVDLHIGKTENGNYAVDIHLPIVLNTMVITNPESSTIKGPFGSSLVAVERGLSLESLIEKYQQITAPKPEHVRFRLIHCTNKHQMQ